MFRLARLPLSKHRRVLNQPDFISSMLSANVREILHFLPNSLVILYAKLTNNQLHFIF